MTTALHIIEEDRAVAVVRAEAIADPGALARAVAEGGIRAVEFTFTTSHVEDVIKEAIASGGNALIGAGTVLTSQHAERAIVAGASFLVTPGLSVGVAGVAQDAGIPIVMGAFTASEVMAALELGVDAIKIFPAITAGPGHLGQLLGPFPGLKLIASGGIDPANAAAFLRQGAVAVAAGSNVVAASAVASADWTAITRRAKVFTTSLGNRPTVEP
jgi:2-dehydro-3-deoxyphosphogluconate aldolase/(4S)-4-hydroxy-2-oxoglutarate aldolase